MPITSEIGSKLTQKVGPLPAWGWAVAIIGGYAVFKLFRPSDKTDTLAPGIYDLGSGGSGGTPPGGGSGGAPGDGGTGTPTPTPTPGGGGGGTPTPTPVPTPTPTPGGGFNWGSFDWRTLFGGGGFPIPIPPVLPPLPTPTTPVPTQPLIQPANTVQQLIDATLPGGVTGVNFDPTAGAYQYVGNAPSTFTPAALGPFQTALDLGSADPGSQSDVNYIATNYYRGDTNAARAGIVNAQASQSGDWSNPMVVANQAIINPVGSYLNDQPGSTVGQANQALGTTVTNAPYYTTDPATGVQTYHSG